MMTHVRNIVKSLLAIYVLFTVCFVFTASTHPHSYSCTSEEIWVTNMRDDVEDAQRTLKELQKSGPLGTMAARATVFTVFGIIAAGAGVILGATRKPFTLSGAAVGVLICWLGGAALGAHSYYSTLSSTQNALTRASIEFMEAEQELAQCETSNSQQRLR